MSPSGSELSDFYDELEGSDSEFKPTSSRSPRKQTGPQEYRLQKALRPPRATTYTAKSLYDQIHNSDVDLSPEYQRDVVWTKEKQTNLIDSIYRNFYIPPIIFAVNTEDDGSEHRTCIDGKQRLTSIQLFMDGLIPHRDPMTGQKYWFKNVDSRNAKDARRQLLPEKLRNLFSNKQIVCVEYTELTEMDERDIFKRVQQGMALTPSEKLGALSAPRTIFVRGLLRSYLTDETLGKLPFDGARGADFRCFSHAVYCMEKWCSDPNEVKNQGTYSQVEKWLEGTRDMAEDFKTQVREVYDIFVKIVNTPKYSGIFFEYKKIAPAEMIFIALLIFVHGIFPSSDSQQLSRSGLCAEISKMRQFIRRCYTDVRMNTNTGKSFTEFIKKIEAREPSPKKSKRKRDDKEEATKQSRRKPLTPDTSSASPAVPPLEPVHLMSPLHKVNQKMSPTESFQAHVPLSPISSSNSIRSAVFDMGAIEEKPNSGPLNRLVIMNPDKECE